MKITWMVPSLKSPLEGELRKYLQNNKHTDWPVNGLTTHSIYHYYHIHFTKHFYTLISYNSYFIAFYICVHPLYFRFLEWELVGDLILGTQLILLDAYQTVSWWNVWSRIAVVSSVWSGWRRKKSLHAYLSCLATAEGTESRHPINMCS